MPRGPTTACPEVFAFSESPWRLARDWPQSHGALGDLGGKHACHAGRRQPAQRPVSAFSQSQWRLARNSPRSRGATENAEIFGGSPRFTWADDSLAKEVSAFSESPWRLARNSPRSHGALGDFWGKHACHAGRRQPAKRGLRLLPVSVAIGEKFAAELRSARRFWGKHACHADRRQPAQKSSPPSPSLRGDWLRGEPSPCPPRLRGEFFLGSSAPWRALLPGPEATGTR